jgi:hypothetical protein
MYVIKSEEMIQSSGADENFLENHSISAWRFEILCQEFSLQLTEDAMTDHQIQYQLQH